MGLNNTIPEPYPDQVRPEPTVHVCVQLLLGHSLVDAVSLWAPGGFI